MKLISALELISYHETIELIFPLLSIFLPKYSCFHKKFLCVVPPEKREDKPCDMLFASRLTFFLPAVKSFSRSHGFQGWFPAHSSLSFSLPSLSFFSFFSFFFSSLCFSTRDNDRFDALYLSTKEASEVGFG
jgi:hypothetical protein